MGTRIQRHRSKQADKAAKEAATSQGTNCNIPTSNYKLLKSAISTCIKREIVQDWNAALQSQASNCNAKQLRQIAKHPNALRGTKLYRLTTLIWRQTAQLT